MRLRVLFSVLAFATAACETVPPTYDPSLFAADLERVEAQLSVALNEADLTQLLARPDLTELQRADLHFLRAETRLNGKYDLPGAIADYETFVQLSPDDPRSATAERRKLFAATDIETAQTRLARLQNLPDWFDDKVLLGELAVGAARYQSAGLTPTEGQLKLLRDSGYICVDAVSEDQQPVHQFGETPDYAENAVWCLDPSLS